MAQTTLGKGTTGYWSLGPQAKGYKRLVRAGQQMGGCKHVWACLPWFVGMSTTV